MKRRQSRFYTVVFLSLFCGQLLAAPFLDCCIAMQHDGAGDHDKAHAHMAMNNSVDSSIPGMAIDMSGDMEAAMVMDCDHRCDLCLVSCAALLPESEDMVVDVNAGLALVLPCTPSLHSFTDNPFRPPITA